VCIAAPLVVDCLQGPVGGELAKHRVAAHLTTLVTLPAASVWTRRAAAKALSVMITMPDLLAASGLTPEQVLVSLQAAGKDDFMCGRAAQSAQKVVAKMQRAASRRDAA